MANPQANTGPRSGRRGEQGRTRTILLILVLLAGAVTAFWLGRDPVKREQAATILESAKQASEAVLEKIGLAPAETSTGATATPELPARVSGPTTAQPEVATQPGALESGLAGSPASTASGEAVTPQGTRSQEEGAASPASPGVATVPGAVPLPGEAALAGANPSLPREPGAETRGLIDPAESRPQDGRQDDAVVKVGFISDLAKWMVSAYQPASRGSGKLAINLQAANLRYGVGMKGLSWIGDDLPKGRSEAINYVFTPGMLDGLYRLYIGRFMDGMTEAMQQPASGNPLSATQQRGLYQLYARQFRAVSGALQGVGAMTDFSSRVERLHKAAQHVVEANARYSELTFALDEARERHTDSAGLAQKVEAAAATYQQSLIDRERTREAFAAQIRKNPAARALDDETLIYVALWIERRVKNDPARMDAALQAATLFLDLAQRFEQRAAHLDSTAAAN